MSTRKGGNRLKTNMRRGERVFWLGSLEATHLAVHRCWGSPGSVLGAAGQGTSLWSLSAHFCKMGTPSMCPTPSVSSCTAALGRAEVPLLIRVRITRRASLNRIGALSWSFLLELTWGWKEWRMYISKKPPGAAAGRGPSLRSLADITPGWWESLPGVVAPVNSGGRRHAWSLSDCLLYNC